MRANESYHGLVLQRTIRCVYCGRKAESQTAIKVQHIQKYFNWIGWVLAENGWKCPLCRAKSDDEIKTQNR